MVLEEIDGFVKVHRAEQKKPIFCGAIKKQGKTG